MIEKNTETWSTVRQYCLEKLDECTQSVSDSILDTAENGALKTARLRQRIETYREIIDLENNHG